MNFAQNFTHIFSALHAQGFDLGRPFRVILGRQRFEHWLGGRVLICVPGSHAARLKRSVICFQLEKVTKFLEISDVF